MNDLESAEKISIDIKKLERNLKQVEDINFEGKENDHSYSYTSQRRSAQFQKRSL